MKKFLLFFICLFLIPKTSDAITWYNGWSEAAKAAEGKGGKAVPCSPEGKYSLCYSSSSYCNPSSNCYSCYYEDSSRCGSCPNGYTLSNGKCFSTSDGPVPKCAAYRYGSCSSWYCEGDYTYTNGKCVKTVSCSGSTPEKSIQADGSIKCSCSSTSCGANAKCIRHPKYNASTLQNNYSYCVCNSGYIMENGICVQEKKAAINGNCPSDMKKSDDGCCCILN